MSDEFTDSDDSKPLFNVFGKLQTNQSTEVSEWAAEKLGEFLSMEYGDHLPSHKRDGGDVPAFGSNGIVGEHSEPYVDKQGLILARKGSIGSVTYSDQPFYPIDTTYYISEDETDENLLWLYYVLGLIDLDRINASTAIPSLNRDDAYALWALRPPRAEQERIASVLYTVDQMINTTQQLIAEHQLVKKAVRKAVLSDINAERQPLGELFDGFETGGTPPTSEEDYYGGGHPVRQSWRYGFE
jgi:type I restriction enzyme S subunit